VPLLEAAGLTIFVVVLFIGVFSIIFGFPGTFLILGDVVVYALATGFEKIGLRVIIILALLSLLAEMADFFMGIAGTAADANFFSSFFIDKFFRVHLQS